MVNPSPPGDDDHRPSLGLARQEDAAEVDVDDLAPLLFRHALGGSRAGDAGCVNPQRQRPERRLDARNGCGHGGRIGHVRDNRHCPAARSEDLRGRGLGVPRDLIDAVGVRARPGELQGYGPADPASGAGDSLTPSLSEKSGLMSWSS